MEPEARFKIDELAEATDLSRRTIHHYIAEGMIPRARGGAGPAAYYDEEHYLRLRLLARLKGMGLSLSTIRDSLNDLSLEEMREVLELPEDMDYRAMWAHIAMQRSGTPESFRVEEAELNEGHDVPRWSSPPPEASSPRRVMGKLRRAGRGRPVTRSMPPADADLLQSGVEESDLWQGEVEDAAPPGTIRRDPEFVDGLADRSRRDVMQRVGSGSPPDRERSFEEYEDKHHIAHMMSPDAYPGVATDPEDLHLHPEMDSQPWRRVRVSSDLEISYRNSDDPLTRKKLRHLLDFVHRLFRLERSSEGLTPDVPSQESWIAEERPAARRTPDHDSRSVGHPRTPGDQPHEEEP